MAKTHCKNGHEFTPENTKIFMSGGFPSRQCLTCTRERGYNQNTYKTHCKRGHKFTPENTLRFGASRSCRLCAKGRSEVFIRKIKKQRITNPELAMIYELTSTLKKFGLKRNDFTTMLDRQNGVCAICEKTERENKRLSVDHDHSTQKVRGLLCAKCNRGLGMFMDNPKFLSRAVDYLRQHQEIAELEVLVEVGN